MKKDGRSTNDGLLPLTRWGLLWDTLRFHFWSLVLVSVLTGLSYLPVLLWLIFATYAGFLDYSSLPSIALTYGVAVFFLLFSAFGAAGLFYYCKKLAWGEGTTLPSDFFEGIAKNWKMSLAIHFLIGVSYLLLRLDVASVAASSLFTSAEAMALDGLSYALFTLFLFVFYLALIQSIIYQGSLFAFLKNGFLLLFGGIVTNIPILLAFFVPFFLFEFASMPYLGYLSYGVASLFYFGFSGFFLTEYADYLFDKSINRKQYPSLIRKGLRKD